MQTHTDLSKDLSYSFNPHKVVLSLTEEADKAAENIDNTRLASCLNKYLQNKNTSCGWASQDQDSTANLCRLLEETTFEAVNSYQQGFESPGAVVKQFKTNDGKFGTLRITANTLLP